MNIQRLTCIAVTMLTFCALGSVADAIHPQHQAGGHPYAAPFPYEYSQGQPAQTWAAQQTSNDDYGGTCCGPRWFDFAVDAVFLHRTDAGIGSRGFASQGIAGFDPPNLVLSASDLEFDWEAGVRATVRHQFNAVTSIEAVYTDAINWNAYASASSDSHDLYSAFSQFGDVPFGGFQEFDQASFVEAAYETDLDSVEVNWRRGWVTPSYKQSGAWIFGFRYLKLDESFRYGSRIEPHRDDINNVDVTASTFNYHVSADNQMYGPQIGADFMTCLFPSVMMGTEFKAGVFANSAEQNTSLSVINPGTNLTTERAEDDDISFLAEANIYGLVQFHPLWKVRFGYQALFLSGVALGIENFNDAPINGATPRTPFLDTNGDAFYHGAYGGIEFGW